MLKIKELFKSSKQKKFDRFKKALIDKKDIEFEIHDVSCIEILKFMKDNSNLFENITTFESEYDRIPIYVKLNAEISADISYFEKKYCIVNFSKLTKSNYKKLVEKVEQ